MYAPHFVSTVAPPRVREATHRKTRLLFFDARLAGMLVHGFEEVIDKLNERVVSMTWWTV